MGIYQRDNINYGGMLGNAMAQRANIIQRDYENYMKQPTAWSNAVQNSGKILQDAAFSVAGKYLDNDLAKDKLAFQQQLQAEENARARKDALDRAREQQKWQAEQNKLQRESTEYIAGLNRKNTVEERSAQNEMNYQNALTAQQYAEQALVNTKPGTMEWAMAQRDLQYAKNKVDYYGSLIDPKLRIPAIPAGTKEDPIVVSGPEAEAALMNENFTTEEPETEWQRKERINLLDTKLKTDKANWTNAIKEDAIKLAKDDPAYLDLINQKGPTIEERKASANAQLKKWDAEFQKMSTMDQDTWLENHPGIGVLNGHLARMKNR